MYIIKFGADQFINYFYNEIRKNLCIDREGTKHRRKNINNALTLTNHRQGI